MATIRDFIESDRQTYYDMSADFYGTGAVLHPVDTRNFAATFDACLAGNPLLRGLALIEDDRMVGYALLSFTWSNEVGGLCVLLEEANILPEYQGRGLGSEYIRFVEQTYTEAKRFRMEVSPTNTRAVQLYERLGYRQIAYLQMTKDLPT